MADLFNLNNKVDLPEIIFFDTNFIFDLLVQKKRKCVKFFDDLVMAKSIITYTPLVIQEYVHIRARAHLRKQAVLNSLRRNDWGKLYKKQPELIKPAIVEATNTFNNFDKIPNVHCINFDLNKAITDSACMLMQTHFLLPMDAFHIASALNEGITAFATTDKDFLRVSDIQVYFC